MNVFTPHTKNETNSDVMSRFATVLVVQCPREIVTPLGPGPRGHYLGGVTVSGGGGVGGVRAACKVTVTIWWWH